MRRRSSFDSDFSGQEADFHLDLDDTTPQPKSPNQKQRNFSEHRANIDYNYDRRADGNQSDHQVQLTKQRPLSARRSVQITPDDEFDRGYSSDFVSKVTPKPLMTFTIADAELISMKKDQILEEQKKGHDEKYDPLGYTQVSIVAQRYAKMESCPVVFSQAFQEGQKTRDNDFTMYFVRIETQISSWVIAYRFSQLQKFHKQMEKKLKKGSKLPEFPPSDFFLFKNNIQVVEKRKNELQNYLNDLARQVDILRDADCVKFFSFEDRTVNLLVDLQDMKSSKTLYKATKMDEQNTAFRTIQLDRFYSDAEVIQYYFGKMRNEKQRQNLLKQLDQYYFECAPRLDSKIMRQILFGSTDGHAQISAFSKQPRGLFLLLKEHANSQLTATAAAKTICKMIDFQKNRHAEVVLSVLGAAEPELINSFNVEELIDSECHQSIMTIYKAYIERRAVDTSNEQVISQLISSQSLRDQVAEYMRQNDFFSQTNSNSRRGSARGRASLAASKESAQKDFCKNSNSSMSAFLSASQTLAAERRNSTKSKQSSQRKISGDSSQELGGRKVSESTEKFQSSGNQDLQAEASGEFDLSSQKSQEAVLHEQPFFDRFLNYFLPTSEVEKDNSSPRTASPSKRQAEEQKEVEQAIGSEDLFDMEDVHESMEFTVEPYTRGSMEFF